MARPARRNRATTNLRRVSAWVSARARNDRAPFLIDDFKAAARDKLGRHLAELIDVRSFATMAMFHEDEWIGNLILIRHEVRPFEAKQAPILQAFADQAAIALSSAQAHEAMAKQAERLRMLHEIDRAIITETAPVAIAEAVLWRLRDLLGVPRAIMADDFC